LIHDCKVETDGNAVMISVIIPVHNSAGSLSRCLEAVAASDYPTYECIVVDDGSTDSSRIIATEFSARVLELTGGPFGPAYARNRGAEAARGEILLFVDADIVVYPDTLIKVAETFACQPRIDATFGCYDDNPAVGEFVSQYKNLFHHFVHQQGREEGTTFWSGCGAIRRDVFLATGGFDEDRYRRPSIEDIELGYRLRAAGHEILLDKDIQVKHLKRWTLRGVIKSDVFDRGIPWTRLILQERHVPNDLNLRSSQRVSALLVCAMPLHLGASLFLRNRIVISFPIWLVAPLLLAVALVMLLNYQFYAFFARKRGATFALAVVPFHLLYYLYSVLAFVLGAGLHLWNTRRQASPTIR
jgi:glycosyltransferase involved in cell wall biosynthesis